jgi:hypothetical protein
MSNTNNLELRALDDDDLMGIVGGCPPCSPPPCHRYCPPPKNECCGGVEVALVICVPLCGL